MNIRTRPSSRGRWRGAVVTVLTSALLAGACGGDGGAATDDITPSTSPAVSVVPDSTTTVPGGDGRPQPVPTEPQGPVMPLTGLPVDQPEVAGRPALVVKIDNGPPARPQSGLNQADIVYEENVEQITRFAAVYHGEAPDPVGPIRSGRTQDIELLGSLNRPLFAWSGGNAVVTAQVRRSDLRDVGALSVYGPGGYFRSSSRRAPHNLYASAVRLMALAPDDAGPPTRQFAYRNAGEDAAGDPVGSVRLSMDGVRVEWTWDATTSLFLRSQGGAPHVGSEGERLSAANVVVLFVPYRASAADVRSPEAVTLGSGTAWLLSDGRWVEGTWSRGDRLEPIALTDSAGSEMTLTPGRTWVQLVRPGKGAVVPAGADPAGVPFP
jgi:hypothetical protein